MVKVKLCASRLPACIRQSPVDSSDASTELVEVVEVVVNAQPPDRLILRSEEGCRGEEG